MPQFQMSDQGPAATFAKILQEAGFDLRDEDAMRWGMLAYNVALLTWKTYEGGGGQTRIGSVGSHMGRNEPCPCGSGIKYKKCCLSKDKSPEPSLVEPIPSRLPFGPKLIPNMTDVSALARDMGVLAEIMDRDEALKDVRFSDEKISAFLEQNPPNDSKVTTADIDDLAFRYARESGEHRLLKTFYEKFLKAAERAQSEEELRALSLGVLLATQARTAKNDDNLLSALLFRKEMSRVLDAYRATEKIIDKLGGKDKILQRLEGRDGSLDDSLKEEMLSAFESLSQAEKDAAMEATEKGDEALWKSICSEEFPIKLPFVTALPFLITFYSAQNDGAAAKKPDYEKIMTDTHQLLADEDARLYAALLDQWLEENTGVSPQKREGLFSRVTDKFKSKGKAENQWTASVCTLRAAITVGNFKHYVDGLLKTTISTWSFSVLHEDEAAILNSWAHQPDDSEVFEKYGNLMDSLGYPKLAQRTRNYSHREGL